MTDQIQEWHRKAAEAFYAKYFHPDESEEGKAAQKNRFAKLIAEHDPTAEYKAMAERYREVLEKVLGCLGDKDKCCAPIIRAALEEGSRKP